MTLRVEFLIFRFTAAFMTRRLMAVLLFVSIRICKSRGRDWNDGDDDVEDIEDVEDVDVEDVEDVGDVEDVENAVAEGRVGPNGGPTHFAARLQHQM